VKRRKFIVSIAGTMAMWPLGTGAQQDRARRLGIIMAVGQTPEYVAALTALERDLGVLGWKLDENLQVGQRWSAGDEQHASAAAADIMALNPDVVLGQSATVIESLLSRTRTVPIVFVHVADPVASGLVSSLSRPGGNVTGITNIEPLIGGKWLQLLKEIAPDITRAALLVNPDTQPDRGEIFLRPFEAAARSLNIAPANGVVRDLQGIEAVMTDLAATPGSAIVVIPDAFFASHSAQIVALAERFRLPAAYPYRYYVAQGGLLCYGVNNVDLFRQAAPYIDRILRGATPADLPVQQPTRFDLVVNRKTAAALGLTVPPSLLGRADEVIE